MNNGINGSIFQNSMTFGEFILLGTSIVLFLGFILSIVFILWGGLLLILSGGKEEKTKPAINTIRYAVLGIFITVGVIFIAPILGQLLGMRDLVEQYFSPTAIYDKITTIASNLFGGESYVGTHTRYINNSGNSGDLGDLDF